MKRLLKIVLKIVTIPIVLLLLIILLLNAIVMYSNSPKDINEIQPTEFAIVFGTSKKLQNGYLNPYYHYRVIAASQLYRAGKVKKIIVSGYRESRYYDEPLNMKSDLINLGIDSDSIIMDTQGDRTLDSLTRYKVLCSDNAPIIVTQQYHAYRTLFLAKSIGLDNAVAYKAKSPENWTFILRNNAREILARVKALIDVAVLKFMH